MTCSCPVDLAFENSEDVDRSLCSPGRAKRKPGVRKNTTVYSFRAGVVCPEPFPDMMSQSSGMGLSVFSFQILGIFVQMRVVFFCFFFTTWGSWCLALAGAISSAPLLPRSKEQQANVLARETYSLVPTRTSSGHQPAILKHLPSQNLSINSSTLKTLHLQYYKL